nr:hypothetical protein [Tanacetum cinerariifolium]
LGGVGPDLLFGAAAEQFEHRLVHRFAHDVPDRDVDRRDGRHADAFTAPGVGLAVHLLPDVFVVERVFANGDRSEEPMASPRSNRMSLALVQKCACGGTTLPFHSKTRVRIALIFMRRVLATAGCAQSFHGVRNRASCNCSSIRRRRIAARWKEFASGEA